MAEEDRVSSGFWELTRAAQHVAEWLVDGPKHIFDDVDATSDLLKLTQRVNNIIQPIIQMLPLNLICEGVSVVTEFFNARNIVGTLSSLISGNAAWEKPFSPDFPNVFRVGSKLAFLVCDCGLLAGWLSSVHILGEWVKTKTAQIETWGRQFKVLDGIEDLACITGSLLDIADAARLIVQEVLIDGYFKNGRVRVSILIDRFIDIASDISSIAASILSNIPGVPAMWPAVSLAAGSTLSLGRFFKKIYWKDPEPQNLRSVYA